MRRPPQPSLTSELRIDVLPRAKMRNATQALYIADARLETLPQLKAFAAPFGSHLS